MSSPLSDEVRRRLTAARVAHLATADGTGTPHLVPVCFALLGESVYTAVDGKPKSGRPLRRLVNLRANPRCSLLVDHYAEDWSRLWWIRLDGRGLVVDDDAESRRAVDGLVAKYVQYREMRPQGPVVRIDIERCSSWPPSPPDA